MDQLINAFGIDLKLIVVQILNFVLMLVVLSYFLYKPILKLLKDRAEKVAKGIQDAEMAAVVKAEAADEKQKIITAANTEAEHITARAKVHADEAQKASAAAASEKAAETLAQAEARAKEMKAQALKDSESEIAKAAVLAAEKILKQS